MSIMVTGFSATLEQAFLSDFRAQNDFTAGLPQLAFGAVLRLPLRTGFATAPRLGALLL